MQSYGHECTGPPEMTTCRSDLAPSGVVGYSYLDGVGGELEAERARSRWGTHLNPGQSAVGVVRSVPRRFHLRHDFLKAHRVRVDFDHRLTLCSE